MTAPHLAAYAMAGILVVAEPGETIYSQVFLESCDAACQATKPCDEPKLVCRAPFWRRDRKTWARAETRTEGLVRYAGIAVQVARVAAAPPPQWRGTPHELVDALVTIARHESAFWLEVQLGHMKGPAGELGLWQANSGSGVPETYRRSLVGPGPGPVFRGAWWATVQLGRARSRCRPSDPSRWFYAAVSAYGSGGTCAGGKWARDRENTYARVRARKRPLPPLARDALDLARGTPPPI